MNEQLTRITADVDQTISFLSDLRAWKSDIAAMRQDGHHLSASIARDEMLNRVERWLDPDGMERRITLQTIQGKAAAELALAIDPQCGF